MTIVNYMTAYRVTKYNEPFQLNDIITRINYDIKEAALDGVREVHVYISSKYPRKIVKEACKLLREQGYSCTMHLLDNDIVIRW